MKTFSAKQSDIEKKWMLIDADGLVLGRLAAYIAVKLRGKDRPFYTPHVDCGCGVVVVNADKIALTGNNKRDKKVFYWHTGYPGGIKSVTAKETLEGNHPERLLQRAIKRMMPKNKLGNQMMSKLKVYSGPDNPHVAQVSEFTDFAVLNIKNSRRNKK